MEHGSSRPQVPTGVGWSQRLGLRVAGAGLLAATAAIHLDLYLTGYRTIPTIGGGPDLTAGTRKYDENVTRSLIWAEVAVRGQPASPRTAASSPSKSSPHGPHARRCVATPG